jgi:hypothetical protein
MKTKWCLLLLILSCNLFAQKAVPIVVVDFVKVLNGHEAETVYFFEQNWKKYRISALKKGHISGYQLLKLNAADKAGFHYALVTFFQDSTAYQQVETNFRPIMARITPKGPRLLNELKIPDFCEITQSFTGNVLIEAGDFSKKQKDNPMVVIDMVEVLEARNAEARFFYDQNWKVYREKALEEGVVSAYRILSLPKGNETGCDLILMTEYPDEAKFKASEDNFRPILQSLRPNGPSLLNEHKPNTFRNIKTNFDALIVLSLKKMIKQ